jgi:solute carrier family 25 carnitine/acylcarnitine transporter 20/29
MQTSSTVAKGAGGGARGAVSCFQDIVRTSGIVNGLYRGVVGPFFAQAVYKSVIFTTNTLVNTYVFTNPHKTATTIFLSGAIAGSMNAFIVSPIEIIRTRQILHPHYGFLQTFRGIVTEGGLASLWRGLVPAMFRDGPGIGMYLLTFEYCKKAWEPPPPPQQEGSSGVVASPSLWPKLLAGACAGVAFWAVALPIDTIKANIEASPGRTSWNRLVAEQLRMVSDRGVGHLFRAWPVAFGRGIPSAAVTLTTFDVMTEWLVRRRVQRTSL